MGMMNNIKNKLNDKNEDIRDRFEELRKKEQNGKLNSKGRAELQRMREQFTHGKY